MPRILFIGDSHSSGFLLTEGPLGNAHPNIWRDNNYAEIYCSENNQLGVIYATPGVSNDRYPDWVKFCLDMYPDIDTVLIQSTYWDRWMTSINPSDNSYEELPLDYFTVQYNDQNNCKRFIDLIQTPKDDVGHSLYNSKMHPAYIEQLENPPTDFIPPFQDTNYIQIKTFNELQTFISKEMYLRNLFIIDRLCRDVGAKCKLWRMNNNVYFPETFDLYGELQIEVFKDSCNDFLKNLGYDDTEYKNYYDNEHYVKEYHELIARKFIPHLFQQ